MLNFVASVCVLSARKFSQVRTVARKVNGDFRHYVCLSALPIIHFRINQNFGNMRTHEQVVSQVKHWTLWWVKERRGKLEKQLTDTMAVNPFSMPFFFAYHGLASFEELADLILASHLLGGHNTGFGKLIDEKILPNVFGTYKLSKGYREAYPVLLEACFDEIDHIVPRADGTKEFMSLKSSKWTIQLTMATQINASFNEIITKHSDIVSKIVVGVIYGKGDGLTDKYEIVRGINRGANHNVIDLTHCVEVHSGREFWKWLNDGEVDTQEWVLEGIIAGVDESGIKQVSKQLLQNFKSEFVRKNEKDVKDENGNFDWYKLLKRVNG